MIHQMSRNSVSVIARLCKRSQSSFEITQCKKEIALLKLEEERILQLEYIKKKYIILNGSDSDQDPTDDDYQHQDRIEDWLKSQNNVDGIYNQFGNTSIPPSKTINFDRANSDRFQRNTTPSSIGNFSTISTNILSRQVKQYLFLCFVISFL